MINETTLMAFLMGLYIVCCFLLGMVGQAFSVGPPGFRWYRYDSDSVVNAVEARHCTVQQVGYPCSSNDTSIYSAVLQAGK